MKLVSDEHPDQATPVLATRSNPAARDQLAMQNEEVRRAHAELDRQRARYFDMFDNAPVGYCIVNAQELILEVNLTAVTLLGVARHELMKRPLYQFIRPKHQPVFHQMRQQLLLSGEPQACELQVLRHFGAHAWVHLVATAAHDDDGRPTMRIVLSDIQRYAEQLKTAMDSTVEVITTISEMRDPYTAGHQRRVAMLAAAIGAELGFDDDRQDGLRVAGYLHDVGKFSIPTEILGKPGRISAIERQLIQAHAQAGFDALKNVKFSWPVAQIALQHHERMDGSGYPQGLKGEAILIEARIMAVADVVEGMSSHRPYRPGLGIDAALEEIGLHRGTRYDKNAVDACIKLFRQCAYTFST